MSNMQAVLEKIDSVETQAVAAANSKVNEVAEAIRGANSRMPLQNLRRKLLQRQQLSRAWARSLCAVTAIAVLLSNSKNTKTVPPMKWNCILFESVDQYDAFLKEASALTGSGTGQGGRVEYDQLFVPERLSNPLRGMSRVVGTVGSDYQFRVKTGNAGWRYGYAIQNNGAATTENTAIWQQSLRDLNVQYPIRTAALDDIDGLDSNVVADMLAEKAQVEGLVFVQNNDQVGTDTGFGNGSDGPRGLNQYAGGNATFTGGSATQSALGASGTGANYRTAFDCDI